MRLISRHDAFGQTVQIRERASVRPVDQGGQSGPVFNRFAAAEVFPSGILLPE